ncbi:YeaC family protein [Denitrificimonas caeni]|uniref:DUF1315 family protein n=1 Tax=Denitrificimonas caeni TaxID=521720 RepID=A0AAF0AIK1_9GAMM|nr:DUF1315 family protein [Denitrificimonas caeni]NLJ12683.1 DUF1315 family protein [Gammaproteobacteria bacterium]WBE24505.1 DUF1315 family protein [Denitrificimonas caeni]
MKSFADLIERITPETYKTLKLAMEIGKWGDGTKLTQEQKELTMQAMILWEQNNLPEEERTGYMGGQECAKQTQKKLSAAEAALFAPATGTLH